MQSINKVFVTRNKVDSTQKVALMSACCALESIYIATTLLPMAPLRKNGSSALTRIVTNGCMKNVLLRMKMAILFVCVEQCSGS